MDTELDKFLKKFGGTNERLYNSKKNEVQSLTKGPEEEDVPYLNVEVSENLERGQNQKQKQLEYKNPNSDYQIGGGMMTNKEGNYMEMLAGAIPSLIKKEPKVEAKQPTKPNPFSGGTATNYANAFKMGSAGSSANSASKFNPSAFKMSTPSLSPNASGGLSNASTGFDHSAFSDRMADAGDTSKGAKGGGFKSTAMGVGAAAGAIGNAMGSHQYNERYMTDKQMKSKDWMEGGKDTAGAIFPVAGMFRGIEKGVVNIAGQTNGDEGAAISQAMFSPSDNIRNIAGSDMDGGEKTLAYLNTVFNPIGAGVMIHRDRMRTKRKQERKEKMEMSEFEKAKRRETYQMEQGLASMENLKALREKQLGLS